MGNRIVEREVEPGRDVRRTRHVIWEMIGKIEWRGTENKEKRPRTLVV